MDRFTRLLRVPNVIAEHEPVVQPIYQSSVFRMPDHAVAARTENLTHPSAYYTRWGNPTVAHLENQLSTLLGCNATLVFPSGMSAITTTVSTLVSPGDLVAVSSALYGDSTRYFLEDLCRWGVRVELFEPDRPDRLPQLVRNGARLVYFESISNPDLRIANFDAIHATCDNKDVITVCDCTFSPPGVLAEAVQPADLVIHSLTKYISGHSSVFGGSVSGWQSLIDRVWHRQSLLGACIDPQAAWQISQNLKSLELRIARQSATAHHLAHRLASHPDVEQVFYPQLDSHPGSVRAAQKYLKSGGGVISVGLKGGERAAIRLVERLRLFGLWVSLGGVSSCIEHASSMSHSMLNAMDDAVLKDAGAARPAANLLRLSVGIEDAGDLWRDLANALLRDDEPVAAPSRAPLQPQAVAG